MNTNCRLVAIALVLGLGCLGLPARASKLDCVRDAVGDNSSGDSDDNDTSESDYYDDEDNLCDGGGCNTGANLWWTCLFPPIGLFICLPVVLIGTDDEDAPADSKMTRDWIPGAYFASRPYADGHRGYLYSSGRFVDQEPQIPGLASWSFRLSAEYAYDYDPVHRPNLAASIDSVYRIGFSTRWTHYIEPIGGGQTDQITIGDVNVTYRFAESEVAQVRLGLGYRMIHDGEISSGVNLTYLVDIFPVDPLVISMDGNIGNLGNALYLHGRLTLGAQLGPVEPYLGYDMVLISSSQVGVLFQGPVAGLRIWM